MGPASVGAAQFSRADFVVTPYDVRDVLSRDFVPAPAGEELVLGCEFCGGVQRLDPYGFGGFEDPDFFSTGGPSVAPVAVMAGNLNAGSDLDLIAVDANSNEVSVLLSNGIGGFGAPTDFTVGTAPSSIAVGNFSADANLDLAVANSASSNVSVLLGNGAGSFGAPSNIGVGTSPRSIAVGNFSADANLDLAVANAGSSSVSVLLGNGAGGFGAPTNIGLSSAPRAIAVADFNEDSEPDLAVTRDGGVASLLLGNGAGGFGSPSDFGVGTNPRGLAVGDLDADGNLDLGVANAGSNDVSLLLGNGAGGFSAARSFEVGATPLAIAIGSFNAGTDSASDLAVGNVGGSGLTILYNAATDLSAAPSSLTFPNQAQGTLSAAQAVTLVNTGPKPLDVAQVNTTSANPDDFLKSGDSCTGVPLDSGASCQIRIRFGPTAAGTRNASLEIRSNAWGSPHAVALSGTSTAAAQAAKKCKKKKKKRGAKSAKKKKKKCKKKGKRKGKRKG